MTADDDRCRDAAAFQRLHDGCPPLVAALSTGRAEPGARRRDDTDDVVRLLLRFGADPHQRGGSDYTALHMAVADARRAKGKRQRAKGGEREEGGDRGGG